RSVDFVVNPTEAAQGTDTPTPTAVATFEMPSHLDTFSSAMLDLSFLYPRGWRTTESAAGVIMSSGAGIDINDIDSRPYIFLQKQHRKDISYRPEYGVVDLFRDNLGSMAVDPKVIDDAPFATAVGRSLGKGQFKINGWMAFIAIDDDNFLLVFAQ